MLGLNEVFAWELHRVRRCFFDDYQTYPNYIVPQSQLNRGVVSFSSNTSAHWACGCFVGGTGVDFPSRRWKSGITTMHSISKWGGCLVDEFCVLMHCSYFMPLSPVWRSMILYSANNHPRVFPVSIDPDSRSRLGGKIMAIGPAICRGATTQNCILSCERYTKLDLTPFVTRCGPRSKPPWKTR